MSEILSIFSFGKYAFYVWVSYLSTVAMLLILYIGEKRERRGVLRDLRLRYKRDEDKHTS